jgi:hypothetical protein
VSANAAQFLTHKFRRETLPPPFAQLTITSTGIPLKKNAAQFAQMLRLIGEKAAQIYCANAAN